MCRTKICDIIAKTAGAAAAEGELVRPVNAGKV